MTVPGLNFIVAQGRQTIWSPKMVVWKIAGRAMPQYTHCAADHEYIQGGVF